MNRICVSAIIPLLTFHTIIAQVSVQYSSDIRGSKFGVSRINQALTENGYEIRHLTDQVADGLQIQVRIDPENIELQPEGFQIKRLERQLIVSAKDASGALYGALTLAEDLQMKGDLNAVGDQLVNPTLQVRGIKFNLPWDPYRDSENMDYHVSTCRDLNFWESFLDMMAENRFNLLALYHKHPFPYMVKLNQFPEACPFSDQEMEEWKFFWKNLFRMAKDRGVDVFLVNWNIVVPKALAEKHQIQERNDTSSLVIDYTRESVRQVINEYEDLAGIGVSLADWMTNMSSSEREDWIAETMVEGINQANRKVKFLHRAVLSGSPKEMRRIIDNANLPDPVLVEIKFNWSHGHSTPNLVITHANSTGEIDRDLWYPEPTNFKIQWMIRNEDFFILRWGEPDFIRSHIKANTKSYANGYYVGSEGYIPAFDYFTRREVGKTWHYAFERQWLFYMLWGRLLYDSTTSDKVFQSKFNRKYGEKGNQMLLAYRLVSRMPLRLASFFMGTWDYTLYSEGFLSPVLDKKYGLNDGNSFFISIDELIDHQVLDPEYLSIVNYVEQITSGRVISKNLITPIALASKLTKDADSAMYILSSMRKYDSIFDSEYRQELDDINTWALLSHYFADKLRAGVALERYRKKGDINQKYQALGYLEQCKKHWFKIVDITSRNYYEVPYLKGGTPGLNHKADPEVDNFSWAKYVNEVLRDLDIARQSVFNKSK